MATKKKKAPAVTVPEPELDPDERLDEEQVKIRLGCSTRVVSKLISDGILEQYVDDDGFKYFDPVEVKEAKAVLAAGKKDVFGELQNKALKDSHELVLRLVQTVIEPIQNTHKALLADNQDLRARLAEKEKSEAELHATYGEIMRASMQMEIDAEREKARLRHMDQGMSMLKEKVLPAIIGSYQSKNVLNNLDTFQIEALLGTEGVLNETLQGIHDDTYW